MGPKIILMTGVKEVLGHYNIPSVAIAMNVLHPRALRTLMLCACILAIAPAKKCCN